jgi:glycyl-tRNA synthetase beta chain
MAELLLEVGCEELPAAFVARALSDLSGQLVNALNASQLLGADHKVATYGTPRRLIVSISGLLDRQEDTEKDVRGPALKGAFNAEGEPTPALLGFCRGQGVDVSTVRKDDQYVWITKHIPGQSAKTILEALLPKTIRELQFQKSMRWGSTRMRFARPIRWLLAILDGVVVPFDIEGVASGNESRGHRFYAPSAFAVSSTDDLLSQLRENFVEPDPAVRRAAILQQIEEKCSGVAEISEDLLDENVYLTEWPTVIEGEFPASFLDLPEPVLVTAMAKHERMFPVRDASGKITNRFLFVRNSGEDDTVRAGSAWVLNARFNDAKFFYQEDQKSTLADFLAKTTGIVFQEKLGTVLSRSERLANVARFVAEATGASEEEAELAELAGRYAKADLSTGLVSELSSLQGIVGAEYARSEGMPEAVVTALRHQYAPTRNTSPATDLGHRTGLRLAMADQLDKLAGFLGLGLEPTGSSDPFGLRRCATVLIESAWAWPGALPAYDQLFDFALDQYREQAIPLDNAGAHTALWDVFEGRYSALMPEVRHDILDAAALSEHRWELTIPQAVKFRVEVMSTLADHTALVQTATRPLNLVASSRKKGMEYGFDDPLRQIVPTDLDSEQGLALLEVLKAQEDDLFRFARERDVEATIRSTEALVAPINAFLDGTMVLVEDAAVRYARLTLLHAASLQLLAAGDFTKLVIEG